MRRPSAIAGVALFIGATLAGCGSPATNVGVAPSPSPGGAPQVEEPLPGEAKNQEAGQGSQSLAPSNEPAVNNIDPGDELPSEPAPPSPKDPLEEGILSFEEKKLERAYELLMPLALKGNAKAQSYIGQFFLYDQSNHVVTSPVNVNIETAVTWLQKSQAQGEPSAMYHLGQLYRSCRETYCSQDEALRWFEKAANLDHAPSQYELGLHYYNVPFLPESTEKSLYWLTQAADGGSYQAKIFLGKVYLGSAISDPNYAKAYTYLAEVVSSQNVKPINTDTSEAKYLLGKMYADGLGLPKDAVKAFELYQSAIRESREARGAGFYGNEEVEKKAREAMETLGVER